MRKAFLSKYYFSTIVVTEVCCWFHQAFLCFLLRADEIEMVMTDLERANQVRRRAMIFQDVSY